LLNGPVLLVLLDRLSFLIGSTIVEVKQAVTGPSDGDDVVGEAGCDG
jgi:hypothetical protein